MAKKPVMVQKAAEAIRTMDSTVKETARLCLCAILANGEANPEPQDAIKLAYKYATAFENHNNT